MEHKVIRIEDYLLVVDDSKLKDGDYFYIVLGGVISKWEEDWNPFYSSEFYKKIIAHLPLNDDSPILKGVDLLPKITNVNLILEEILTKKAKNVSIDLNAYAIGFDEGYEEATKVYSEEDLRTAIKLARNPDAHPNDIIQSLSKIKIPVGFDKNTTMNQGGNIIWVGTYIY